MHHKQAAAPPRPEVVQNRHKLRTEMVQFQAKEAFCRFVSAELFSFLLKKGRLAVLFHFWHSPCFISIVLAAAITEYCLEGTYEAGYRGNQTIQTGRRA